MILKSGGWLLMSLNHLKSDDLKEIFALVDCNSFYASCERVFNPRLRKHPVVVLSNNDGCIIALSQEAKDVGIKMGAPIFQCRDLIKKHQVAVFSSNYTLYGDMSARVMQTLLDFSPEIEIYSIDEAFLGLKGFDFRSLSEYGYAIKKTVYQHTGIPVSVGIGPTKVLAKLANRIAKKQKLGSFSILHHPDPDQILRSFNVGDLWGVGFQSQKKLERYGIKTALDLKMANPELVRSLLTVVGSRIQNELNGISCLSLEETEKPKKQIISSRSFGELLSDLNLIKEAMANHVSRAAHKLRAQKSVCLAMQIFLHTNPFRSQDTQYYGSQTIQLPSGMNETNQLIQYALTATRAIFRDHLKFKKCGVMLMDIHPSAEAQMDLFGASSSEKSKAAIFWMDEINARFGSDTVKFAACGTKKHWQMRSEHRSNRYTTHWGELFEVD
jgi:DNA polymerase V